MAKKLFSLLVVLSLFSAQVVYGQDESPEAFPEEIAAQEYLPEEQAPPALPAVNAPAVVISGAQNKITLDIKGMDIVDVLKMLATRSGMNIVIGKNVTGRVTLFLKDVDTSDAFEIILMANDLACERKGGIVNVMTQRDYELLYGERYKDNKQAKLIKLKYAKAADLSRALNQVKTNIGRIVVDEASNTVLLIDSAEKVSEMEEFISNTDLPLATIIYSLNYAQADKISPKIQELLTKGVGTMKIDERTNKIAVTDYPERLEEVAKIINAFDEKTPQVLIDAQIIEIKPSDKFEMGVDWNYWIEKYFDIKASLPIGTANRLIMGTATADPTKKGQYKAVIDILRTIGDIKILSSPRIMALNNQEAKIHVGLRDAYITSTTSQSGTGTAITSQSVNFVDTGIQLYVTPTVNRDGFVTMKIKPEISDSERQPIKSEGQITEIPIVTSSEAETTVMVKDGVTIIIGGLSKDKREKKIKRIPLIGDIPLLGYLFQSTSDDLTKTELVILLTPHIMSGESTFTDFGQIPPKDGAVAKMFKGQIVTEKFSSVSKEASAELTNLEYYQFISDKVKASALFASVQGEKGSVGISFIVDASGQLKDEPKIVSSSNKNLDKIVVDSIKKAAPFPVFPKQLKAKEQSFNIKLDYR
ncbi:MAG: TonB family protein [Candidatus Omnitrophota bacterium]